MGKALKGGAKRVLADDLRGKIASLLEKLPVPPRVYDTVDWERCRTVLCAWSRRNHRVSTEGAFAAADTLLFETEAFTTPLYESVAPAYEHEQTALAILSSVADALSAEGEHQPTNAELVRMHRSAKKMASAMDYLLQIAHGKMPYSAMQQWIDEMVRAFRGHRFWPRDCKELTLAFVGPEVEKRIGMHCGVSYHDAIWQACLFMLAIAHSRSVNGGDRVLDPLRLEEITLDSHQFRTLFTIIKEAWPSLIDGQSLEPVLEEEYLRAVERRRATGPAETPPIQPRRVKRGGRPPDTDPAADAAIRDEWQKYADNTPNATYAKFAATKGLKAGNVKAAVDRARKQRP